MQVKIKNVKGAEVGSATLKAEVFEKRARPGTINDVVKAQRANERQGTVSTKTRSFVAGGGKKPWRQKGTGRSRQGSTRSPLWPGGATCFGPLPRTFDQRPPKKMVDRAVAGICTDKAAHQKVMVFDSLAFESGKAADVRAFLKANAIKSALLVVPEITEKLALATRNFKQIKVVVPMNVNALDLLRYDVLALSDKARAALEEMYA